MGFSKSTTNLDHQQLWSLNKKIIDAIATRYQTIGDSLVRIKVDDGKKTYTEHYKCKKIPKNINNPGLGVRPIYFSEYIWLSYYDILNLGDGEEVTLLNWMNAFYNKKDNVLKLNSNGDIKSTNKKLFWLASTEGLSPTEILVNIYPNDAEEKIVRKKIIGEADMYNLEKGKYVQLMRGDYYIVDDFIKADKKTGTNDTLVLNKIN